MPRIVFLIIHSVLLLTLTACTGSMHRQVDHLYQAHDTRAQQWMQAAEQESHRQSPFWIDEKNTFFIVSSSDKQTLLKEHRLPDKTSMITVRFADPHTLSYWLQIISADTHLKIHVSADVSALTMSQQKMSVYYQGSVEGLLNLLTEHYHLFWRYDQGSVVIFQYKTDIFQVHIIPGQVMQVASVGQKTQPSESHESHAHVVSVHHFDADNQARLASTLDVWKSLGEQIKAILPPHTFFSLNRATGTVVVKADPETLSLVHHLIEQLNRLLTIPIRLKIDVLSLHFDQNSATGFEWHVIYNKIADLARGISLDMTGSSAVSTEASTPTLSLAVPSQPWAGTRVMIDALRSIAKVHIDRSLIVTTLNRQSVPIGITNQLSYLAETTPAVVNNGQTSLVSSGVGLVPGVVSYGFVMNALPIVLDRHRILLQFVLNISDLEKLSTVETGQGYTLQKIQTPELSSVEFVHRALLSEGQPLLLSAYEKSQGNTARSAALSGIGQSARRFHEVMVILVTPWFRDDGQ